MSYNHGNFISNKRKFLKYTPKRPHMNCASWSILHKNTKLLICSSTPPLVELQESSKNSNKFKLESDAIIKQNIPVCKPVIWKQFVSHKLKKLQKLLDKHCKSITYGFWYQKILQSGMKNLSLDRRSQEVLKKR